MYLTRLCSYFLICVCRCSAVLLALQVYCHGILDVLQDEFGPVLMQYPFDFPDDVKKMQEEGGGELLCAQRGGIVFM